jgi:hypothetical protein
MDYASTVMAQLLMTDAINSSLRASLLHQVIYAQDQRYRNCDSHDNTEEGEPAKEDTHCEEIAERPTNDYDECHE